MWPALVTLAAIASISGSRLAVCGRRRLALTDVPALVFALLTALGLAGLATVASALVVGRLMSTPPSGDVLATIRTGVWSALVIGFARLAPGGRFSAVGRLAYPLLAVAGLKLALIDLRVSRASTLFAALAFYGVALLMVPRERRVTD
jgi:hypothetical protein